MQKKNKNRGQPDSCQVRVSTKYVIVHVHVFAGTFIWHTVHVLCILTINSLPLYVLFLRLADSVSGCTFMYTVPANCTHAALEEQYVSRPRKKENIGFVLNGWVGGVNSKRNIFVSWKISKFTDGPLAAWYKC